MEIEKVIRIVATFIALMSAGIWIATAVLFPESRSAFRMLPLIVVGYGLWLVWHKRCPQSQKDQ